MVQGRRLPSNLEPVSTGRIESDERGRARTRGEAPRPEVGSLPDESMVEMSVYGVSFDVIGKQPIVLLKTAEGDRYLPIWIGHPEAAAILMKLQGTPAPRPLTHDLLVNILGSLEVEIVRVTVTELRDNTFYATITLRQGENELEIDSRSSDAIAVAVRAQAPIFAADGVIEESSIEFEGELPGDDEEIVDEFKEFLERVSAEDFAERDDDDD